MATTVTVDAVFECIPTNAAMTAVQAVGLGAIVFSANFGGSSGGSGPQSGPNLMAPSQVYGRTTTISPGTSLASVLENTAGSQALIKVNTIRSSNVSSSTAETDVAITRSGINTYLLKGGRVDAGESLVVADKNEYIYLQEGDQLQARASASGSVDLSIHYEVIS